MAKDKIVVCKHCGAEIAASAKTCPKCGGKNSKPFYKKVWFWILVAVLVIGVAGAAGGSDDSDSTNTANTTEQSEEAKQEEAAIEYQDVSVETLFEALDSNAASASDTYKDQYLSITGVLGTIDSDGSYIGIESTDDNYMFQSVQCYIKNDEQLEKIKSMSKGDAITIKGKVKDVGEVLGYTVDIDSIE